MTSLIRNFLRGCLVVVPAAVTIYVVYAILVAVDGVLALPIPGLGFVLTLTGITLVGALASNVVVRRVFEGADALLIRVPLVKLVYTSLRDLVNAFVGDKKRFQHPVVITLDGDAMAFGFITRDDLIDLGLPGHVAVYMPQAYALAGLLIAFPRERVRPVAMEPARFMALIVSGGVANSAPTTSTRL
jgi:uncharacterized membrane protein